MGLGTISAGNNVEDKSNNIISPFLLGKISYLQFVIIDIRQDVQE